MSRWSSTFVAIALAAGCGGPDEFEAEDGEDFGASDAALTATEAKLVGTYTSRTTEVGRFSLVDLRGDNSYTTETVVACFRAPCTPQREVGKWTATTASVKFGSKRIPYTVSGTKLTLKEGSTGTTHTLTRPSAVVADLGLLAKPGTKLADTTQAVAKGAMLQFETRESVVVGFTSVTASGALKVTRANVEPSPPGLAGGSAKYRTSFQVPASASSGTTYTVTAKAHYQSRNDPEWNFTFRVKVP